MRLLQIDHISGTLIFRIVITQTKKILSGWTNYRQFPRLFSQEFFEKPKVKVAYERLEV